MGTNLQKVNVDVEKSNNQRTLKRLQAYANQTKKIKKAKED